MALGLCIPDLIAQGKLTGQKAKDAQEAYDRHYRRFAANMSPEAAAAEATEAAVKELEYAAALKKRQTLLQVQAQSRILSDIQALADAGDNPYSAATKLLAAGPGKNVLNVEMQHKAIAGRAHAIVEGILEKHSRNLVGEVRDKTGLDDLVREAFGEATGNSSAKELADAWGKASEYLRQRFNKAGGNIAKRADWGLPQSHDMLKVRATGFEAWRAEVAPRLDVGRMIDNETGQPFTPEGLDAALQEVFQSIRSDGWNKRDAGSGGRGKLANQRADARFLVFKSADDWLAYQAKFGAGTAFDAMMGHIEGMSRDIARLEVMGPNPEATLRWLTDSLKKKAATDPETSASALDMARSAEQRVRDLYDVVSGNLNAPVNAVWARRMSSVRNVLSSAMLGSASLSAITDVGFQAVTRAYNGLPITGAIRGYLGLFRTLGNAEKQRIAVRLGLIAEEAAKRATALQRYVDSGMGNEVARRLSDGVLRVSGLSPWTQVGRWAFGMEVLGHLADVRGKSFAELGRGFSGMLERYGIGEKEWDSIRTTDPYRYKGGEWLRPDDVMDEALGDKLLRMVLTETDYAVPAVTARSRALMSLGQRPGTLTGELVRSTALFKSFGVSMLLTHGARMMEGRPWNRLAYAAGLTITTTLLGALAMQLKELAKGKDEQDMSTPQFWGKAALQGGGFGIFGDFLGSSVNRVGGGLAETFAGPVVGTVSDVGQSAGKLVRDAMDPAKQANPGAETIKLLKRYMPGGSLWYARAAYERVLLDQLQEEIDPDYAKSWGRMEARAARDGQGYWWRPGDLAPERSPEMGESPR